MLTSEQLESTGIRIARLHRVDIGAGSSSILIHFLHLDQVFVSSRDPSSTSAAQHNAVVSSTSSTISSSQEPSSAAPSKKNHELCIIPIGDSITQLYTKDWASSTNRRYKTNNSEGVCNGVTSWRYFVWKKLVENLKTGSKKSRSLRALRRMRRTRNSRGTSSSKSNRRNLSATTTDHDQPDSTSSISFRFLGSMNNNFGNPLGKSPHEYDYGKQCFPDVNGERFSNRHESHTGWRLADMVGEHNSPQLPSSAGEPGTKLKAWLAGETVPEGETAVPFPDSGYKDAKLYNGGSCSSVCVIFAIGTNDVWMNGNRGWSTRTTADTIADFRTAMEQIREHVGTSRSGTGGDVKQDDPNKFLHFVVGTPPPQCRNADMRDLGKAIMKEFDPSSTSTASSSSSTSTQNGEKDTGSATSAAVDYSALDLQSGYSVKDMTIDFCHPNEVGSKYFADRIFPAIVERCLPPSLSRGLITTSTTTTTGAQPEKAKTLASSGKEEPASSSPSATKDEDSSSTSSSSSPAYLKLDDDVSAATGRVRRGSIFKREKTFLRQWLWFVDHPEMLLTLFGMFLL